MAMNARGEWEHVVLDKHGKALAMGAAVTVGGKAGTVQQLIVKHPAPPIEYMQHASYSVLVKLDDGEERHVDAVDIEQA